MINNGRNEIIKNQTHCKLPSNFIHRDEWINLGIDLDSFVVQCFSNVQ